MILRPKKKFQKVQAAYEDLKDYNKRQQYDQVREDPVFRRKGSDIHVDAGLSIPELLELTVALLQMWIIFFDR